MKKIIFGWKQIFISMLVFLAAAWVMASCIGYKHPYRSTATFFEKFFTFENEYEYDDR